MKITKTYNWNRRDFTYDAKCEGCGTEIVNRSGYDDDNYYNNVIPDKKCPSCGKSSNDMGTADEPQTPRYDPYLTM